MSQSPKTLEFLQKLKDSGNWNDDYDYSKVDYKTSRDRVKIINKSSNTIHNVRIQVLLKGYGCVMENAIDKTKFALSIYKKSHGNKYEYTLFNYVNNKTNIKVICKEHGVFEISHNKHSNVRGCPTCALRNRGLKRKLN